MEQERDDRKLTPEQVREYETSRGVFGERMENDSEKIHEHALFEKYLREELEIKEIKMDEKDISQIIGFEKREEYPNTADLETIRSRIRTQTGGDDRLITRESKLGGASQTLSGELRDVFLKRYPVDELAAVISAAQNNAREEIRIEKLRQAKLKQAEKEEEAHKKVDEF